MVMRAAKIARIIENLCSLYGVTLQEATDMYYESEISQLIEEGVSDLQCRSDKYLATLVWEDYKRT